MNSMRCLILSLCVLPLAFSQDVPVFRSTTELVLVDVQVVHKKTKTATGGLAQKDFQIYEDGAAQEIKSFSRDQLPLSIVLLFDLTDSSRPVLKELAAGAKAALAHLKPEDEVAVMEYAATATLVDGFTTDRSRTVQAIERAAADKSGEAAFFNEAVYQASQQLRQAVNPSSRRVIIWLTDNLANAPGKDQHTEQEAFRSLYESGTVVSALLKKSALAMIWVAPLWALEAGARAKNPAGDANKYAERTGGEALKLERKKVDERLAELIDDLRARYTIGFSPPEGKPAGTFCKLRVELAPGAPLRAKEWNVLTTAGYYRR